ncbi:MAG: hypothetical protein HDT42_01965 [Ruminococcaceae bacterium]|nr:hypothetical protein [Oscillospiraceae bacterium]
MKNKEKSYADELCRCRENIAKTKKLIEYHKDMLKKMERKEAEVQAKLDGAKLLDLRELISKGGYDIDTLREAMKAGDFSEISVQNTAESNVENIPLSEENIGSTVEEKISKRKDDI